MEMLQIEFVPGSPSVLRLDGEIDLATEDQLRNALFEALSVDANVVIDMAEVTFIDASGIRVVLEAAQSLDGAKPLVLVNAPRAEWLLEVVGLEDLSAVEIREGGDPRGC
jgi:anti-sigma B factor antagonist